MDKLLAIIGQAKAGTTSLANWLGDHPSFTLGKRKEPRFFSDFSGQTWNGPGSEGFMETMISNYDSYLKNFEDHSQDVWRIDGSTDYLWNEASRTRLLDFSKSHHVKLICIVRDPLNRAISEYNHSLRLGWETCSFRTSLDLEVDRRSKNWHPLFYHKRRSEICDDIVRYQETFGRHLLIMPFSSLRDPQAAIASVCDFLDVPFIPVGATDIKNRSIVPKKDLISRGLRSPIARHVARTVLPKTLRTKAWSALHVEAKTASPISFEERAAYKSLIASEVERCQNNPDIPTDDWEIY